MRGRTGTCRDLERPVNCWAMADLDRYRYCGRSHCRALAPSTAGAAPAATD